MVRLACGSSRSHEWEWPIKEKRANHCCWYLKVSASALQENSSVCPGRSLPSGTLKSTAVPMTIAMSDWQAPVPCQPCHQREGAATNCEKGVRFRLESYPVKSQPATATRLCSPDTEWYHMCQTIGTTLRQISVPLLPITCACSAPLTTYAKGVRRYTIEWCWGRHLQTMSH